MPAKKEETRISTLCIGSNDAGIIADLSTEIHSRRKSSTNRPASEYHLAVVTVPPLAGECERLSRCEFEVLIVEERQNISGVRIRQVRRQHGLNQVELAAALNVDYGIKLEQSDISEIERQVRSLKDYELDAIAKVLDIDPVWLLRGDE